MIISLVYESNKNQTYINRNFMEYNSLSWDILENPNGMAKVFYTTSWIMLYIRSVSTKYSTLQLNRCLLVEFCHRRFNCSPTLLVGIFPAVQSAILFIESSPLWPLDIPSHLYWRLDSHLPPWINIIPISDQMWGFRHLSCHSITVHDPTSMRQTLPQGKRRSCPIPLG